LSLEGHGRDGAPIIVRVSYHSHVFSIADGDGALAHRFMDEAGKWRSFCQTRYSKSLALPHVCGEMVENNFPSWVSQDRNRRNNMAVTDANAAVGWQYVIMYSLFPSSAKGFDVELVVKSAYEKEVVGLHKLKKSGIRQLVKTCYFQQVAIPK
jgi:hypothetical protein